MPFSTKLLLLRGDPEASQAGLWPSYPGPDVNSRLGKQINEREMSNDLINDHIGSLNNLIASKSNNNKNEKKVKKSVTTNTRTYLDEARISLKKDEVRLKKVKDYYNNSVPTKKSNNKIKLLNKIMHKS